MQFITTQTEKSLSQAMVRLQQACCALISSDTEDPALLDARCLCRSTLMRAAGIHDFIMRGHLVILSREEAVEELTVEQALSLAGLLTAAASEAIQRAAGGDALSRDQVESLMRPNAWEFIIGELCTTHGCTPQQAERALREQLVTRYQTDQHFQELAAAAVKIVMHLDGCRKSTSNNTTGGATMTSPGPDRALLERVRDFLIKHHADARHSTEWSNKDAADLFHAVQARLSSSAPPATETNTEG